MAPSALPISIWEAVLAALASARRHLRDLPVLGRVALSALEEALFAASTDKAAPEASAAEGCDALLCGPMENCPIT